MADTRPFNTYFANRGELPGKVMIDNDEILVLRGTTVYRTEGGQEHAYASMEGNVLETTIVTVDVWEEIAGVLVEDTLSTTDGFTFAANQFTYIGVNQAQPSLLVAKMSVSKSGGGDNIYQIGIFVNGIQVNTGMSCGASTALVGFAQTDSTHALQTGDIIDMRVRNISGNSSVTLIDAQLVMG